MNNRIMFVISAVLMILAPFTYMQCDAVQARHAPSRVDSKTIPGKNASGQSTLGSPAHRFVMTVDEIRESKVKQTQPNSDVGASNKSGKTP
jgi:hypothetical protein